MQIAPTDSRKSVPLLRVGLLLSIFVCFSLGMGDAIARLVDVSLMQLVRKSQIIARGHTSRVENDGLEVRFEVEQILKGSLQPGDNLVLCNDPRDTESYDLAMLNVSYFLFASRKGNCYEGVHGVSSIVKVSKGTVLTVGIADQPASQTTDEFASKIRSHLRQ